MLILTNTTDKIQVVTDTGGLLMDVHASFADLNVSTEAVTPDKQNTAITTATTTDIVAAPSSGFRRTVQTLNVRNRDGSAATDVVVQYNATGTLYTLFRASISPGDVVFYSEETGWIVLDRFVGLATPKSTADQVANAADTYLVGSGIAIPNTRKLSVGTILKWKFIATKTAASTATGIWNVRFGTLGTTGDTARLTFTMTAQTAAVDTGIFEIFATVRGPMGASTIVQGLFNGQHHLATTGFMNLNHNVINVQSAGFDATIDNLIIGVSANPGAAGVWTFNQVFAEVLNL